MDACEALQLAGLRRKVGPHGDVMAAYRQWNMEQIEDHAQHLREMLESLSRRVEAYGC
jgi:hypothetical protein